MIETASEKIGPTAGEKSMSQSGEKSGPTAVERAVANSRQSRRHELEVTSVLDNECDTRTHATMCTRLRSSSSKHKRSRNRQSHVRSTNDCGVTTRCSSRTRLRIEHRSLRDDRRGWPRQCLEAASSRSSSTRAASDPRVTQRQVPTIQKIPKTVEIPQVQFMPSCHTETGWLTCPLRCEIMSPWSRQRRTLLRSLGSITSAGPRVCQL